ncbi:MAG TPA: AraC family transcriptional regulator [Verrucomicrobiae bacterium]
MSAATGDNFFFRYFPISVRDRKWGWYVTTAGETRLLPRQPYPPSGHPKGYHFDWTKGRVLDCHALVYISHGRGSFESRLGARQPIEAGQIILLFPGVWHRYRPDAETGWDEHWVGFDGAVARRWVKNNFFSPHKPVFKPGQEEKWLVLFTELITVIKLNRPALQQVMAGFAAQMLGLLYSGQQAGLAGDDQALLIVQRAITKMQTELENGLNAEALARELNVSYSSFRHTFQQHTGSSPHQYLLELRLVRARNLLTQTALSVKEIAQEAGFDDEHYFCRFFKMKTGLTPGQWRVRLKAQA